MINNIKVLAISGSLRKASFNRMALQIAKQIASETGVEVVEGDLKDLNLPIYDGDIEDAGKPESVIKIEEMVQNSDVLLIASPEYNHSVSGALKNAIDWLSRDGNSLKGKYAAIFGVSGGSMGTVRGQYHLRPMLATLNVFVLPKPQVLIKNGAEAFNEDGSFSDPKTYEILKKLIVNTIEMASRMKNDN